MSKANNLTDFLTDIASTLRTKKGYSSTTLINPQDFSDEISSITTVNNQDKTITPSTSEQKITADSGYTGIGTATVSAMPTQTLPTSAASSSTGTLKATISRSTSDQYINIPTGYNSAAAYYKVSAVANTTLPTSTASAATSGYTSVATVSRSTSDQYINIAAGYNTTNSYYKISAVANTTLPTATSASASSGYTSVATVSRSTADQYLNIPAGYNTTNSYYKISAVANMTLPTAAASSATSGYTSKATISRSTSDQYINIPTGYNTAGAYYKISAVANGSATTPATTITATMSGPTYDSTSGKYLVTASKTQSVTPTVSAGYVSSGTAGDITVSGTQPITAGAVTNNTTLPSGSSSSGTINRANYIKIGAGYYPSDLYYYAQAAETLSGDAAVGNVLSGKTFYNTTYTKQTGTMTNNGAITTTISSQNGTYTIPAGYHNGSGVVTATITSGSATPSASYATLSSAGSSATSVTSQYFKITPTASVGTAGYISSISNGTVQNYTIQSAATFAMTGSAVTDEVTVGTAASGYYPLSAKVKGTVSSTTAGWFSSSGAVQASTATQVGKIAAGSVTNNTTLPSGSSSSGTINRSSYIKIGKGYYSTDLYYLAQAAETLSGDAAVANVLADKTFYSNSYTKQTGTMTNNGAVTKTISAQNGTYTIPAGYHNGSGVVTATLSNASVSASFSNSGLTNYFTLSGSSSYNVSITPGWSNTTAGYVATSTGTDGTTNYYSIKTTTLPTSTASSSTSGYTSVATVSRSTADQYINIPTGWIGTASYYKISAVANGSVSVPDTLVSTTMSGPTYNSTLQCYLVTVSGSQSVSPTVSEGYVSSGTAGTMSVTNSKTIAAGAVTNNTTLPSGSSSSGTINRANYIKIGAGYYPSDLYYYAQAAETLSGDATTGSVLKGKTFYSSSYTKQTGTIESKAAATYNTSTSDQTISSGYYLSGTQTIKAVKTTNLTAANILEGVTVKVGDANDDDRIASITGTSVAEYNYTLAVNSPSGELYNNMVDPQQTGEYPVDSLTFTEAGQYSIDVFNDRYSDADTYLDVYIDSQDLPSSTSSSATGAAVATINPTASTQYINIPTGMQEENHYYTINPKGRSWYLAMGYYGTISYGQTTAYSSSVHCECFTLTAATSYSDTVKNAGSSFSSSYYAYVLAYMSMPSNSTLIFSNGDAVPQDKALYVGEFDYLYRSTYSGVFSKASLPVYMYWTSDSNKLYFIYLSTGSTAPTYYFPAGTSTTAQTDNLFITTRIYLAYTVATGTTSIALTSALTYSTYSNRYSIAKSSYSSMTSPNSSRFEKITVPYANNYGSIKRLVGIQFSVAFASTSSGTISASLILSGLTSE